MKSSKGPNVCLSVLLSVVFVLASTVTSSAAPEDPLQNLYAAAKADHEVVWQFPSAVQQVSSVTDAFRARFPDIKVTVVSISATSLTSRIIVEAAARKLSMDVCTSFAGYLLPVIERDLLDRCDWVKNVDPKRVLFGGRFISAADVPQIWVYNTKLVSKAEVPKKLEDTLDPRWKDGKISVRAAPSGFNWLFPVWKQDKQKVVDYLKRLASQDILPGTRGSEVINRIATGECPIGVTGVSGVITSLSKGRP